MAATNALQQAIEEEKQEWLPSILRRMDKLAPGVVGDGYIMSTSLIALGELASAEDRAVIDRFVSVLNHQAWRDPYDDAEVQGAGIRALAKLRAREAVERMQVWLLESNECSPRT